MSPQGLRFAIPRYLPRLLKVPNPPLELRPLQLLLRERPSSRRQWRVSRRRGDVSELGKLVTDHLLVHVQQGWCDRVASIEVGARFQTGAWRRAAKPAGALEITPAARSLCASTPEPHIPAIEPVSSARLSRPALPFQDSWHSRRRQKPLDAALRSSRGCAAMPLNAENLPPSYQITRRTLHTSRVRPTLALTLGARVPMRRLWPADSCPDAAACSTFSALGAGSRAAATSSHVGRPMPRSSRGRASV